MRSFINKTQLHVSSYVSYYSCSGKSDLLEIFSYLEEIPLWQVTARHWPPLHQQDISQSYVKY